ncbi:MAG: hypothetical protein ACOH2H_16095 [Cypionkella sp.]
MDVLDRFERQGHSANAIADLYGISQNAVFMLAYRTRQSCAAEDRRENSGADLDLGSGPVVKPENMDGGMPARWWDARDQSKMRRVR